MKLSKLTFSSLLHNPTKKDPHFFRFKTRFDKDFSSALSIILLLTLIIFLGLLLTTNNHTNSIIIGVISAISLIALAIKGKFPLPRKIIFSCLPLFYTAFIISTLKELFNQDSPYYYYLMGNILGCLEIFFLSQFHSSLKRLFWIFTFFIAKLVPLSIESEWTCVITVCFLSSFTSILTLFSNVFEWQSFQQISHACQNLKTFKKILYEGLPMKILIITCDLNTILYQNKYFKNIFESDVNIKDTNSIQFFLQQFQVSNLVSDDSSSPTFHEHGTLNLFDYIHKYTFELEQKPDYINISTTFKCSEKNLSHFNVRLQHITWDNQPSFVLLFNDVTNWQTSQTLKLADEQKDRVIATLSHELRTPINGILGLVDILEANTKDPNNLKYLEYCKSCSKLLLYLVNSIFDLQQLRCNALRLSKQTFNLNHLFDEVRNLYSFQSQQNNIEFEVSKDPNVPNFIYTDRSRLMIILINLLNNSFKFTNHGSIKLHVSLDEVDQNRLKFMLTDTGIGVKEEDKPRILSMFGQQLDEKAKNINSNGVGFGLTIANKLAIVLNGSKEKEEIEFNSSYNKGSEVIFRILYQAPKRLSFLNELDVSIDCPYTSIDLDEFYGEEFHLDTKIKSSQTVRSSFTKANTSGNLLNLVPVTQQSSWLTVPQFPSFLKTSQTRRIMVVDDNHFNLLAVGFILEKNGFDVIKAVSGKECLKLLNKSVENKKPIDLILMDIQMPVLDGIETSSIISMQIQEGKLYKVPVIAFTAKESTEEELVEYRKCGILDILEKPFQEDKFRRLVNLYCSFSVPALEK